MSDAVLAIENLTVALPSWADRPCAVDGVSLEILRKEILCVVGESGSLKRIATSDGLHSIMAMGGDVVGVGPHAIVWFSAAKLARNN